MKKKILLIALCVCILATSCIVYVIIHNKALVVKHHRDLITLKNKRESISETIWNSLRNPKEMTLFSIDPIENEELKPTEQDVIFHGFKSLGSIVIKDLEAQSIVAREIENAVVTLEMEPYKCFFPRHGVRVSDGKTVFDFLICYECKALYIYEGERKIKEIVIGGSIDVLNEILIKAKVPLPKEEK